MNSCLITGTFDPITLGHLDIIDRCTKIFDKVYVAILVNDAKTTMFNLSDRIKIAKASFTSYDNVEVLSFDGLCIDLAKALKVSTIVRGLRGVSDFDYEKNMAKVNEVTGDIPTMFMMSNVPHISSTVVRELIRNNGDYAKFLTKEQADIILEIRKNELRQYIEKMR